MSATLGAAMAPPPTASATLRVTSCISARLASSAAPSRSIPECPGG